MKPLLVVIDTNVLLVSISSKSKYHWLYQAVLGKKIRIAFSHQILTEYEEQIGNHWHPDVADDVTRSLTELSGALFISVSYKLNLIIADEDDNKFVDCAFAANADSSLLTTIILTGLKKLTFP